MSARILLVDDDPELRDLLREQLEARGYEVAAAHDATSALEVVETSRVDVVLTDLRMPGRSGMELCRECVGRHPEVPVVLMTAFGSVDAAMDAVRAGAYDFLTKPFEVERLELVLERALGEQALRDEVRRLRRQTGDEPGFAGMLGTSAPMERLYELVDRVARSDASVLILGESGTGKELVARALHSRSRRSQGPFVAVNCAAMPEHLLESELFGHERGAFTDARGTRRGLMREAEGGTVFLDEIGDLSPALQPKLLRALQERKVRPVGGDREVDVDVRVLAATHHALRAEVEEGRFRADLFYRLAVIAVDVPPLRERGDDVLLLAQAFIDEIAARERRDPPEMSSAFAARLLGWRWPGNVRELHNCIERCVALATGETLEVEHLPLELRGTSLEVEEVREPESMASLFDVERRHVLRVLEAADGNKSRAARILGIDRKTLHARLLRYGRG